MNLLNHVLGKGREEEEEKQRNPSKQLKYSQAPYVISVSPVASSWQVKQNAKGLYSLSFMMIAQC